MNYVTAVCKKCGIGFTAEGDKPEYSCPLCGNKVASGEFKTYPLSVELGRELYSADRSLFSGDRKTAGKGYKKASKLDKNNPFALLGIALSKHGVTFDGVAVKTADGKPLEKDGAYKKAVKIGDGKIKLSTGEYIPPKPNKLSDFKIDNGELKYYMGDKDDEEIVIPPSVKKISGFAFFTCNKLKSIHIPASVTFIADQAFTTAPAIEQITVAPTNKKYKVDGGCLIDTEYNTLKRGTPSAVIPPYVQRIDDYAFERCDGMSSIVIPEGVMRIGEYAFGGDEELKHVELPASLKEIEEGAFSFCADVEFTISPQNERFCVVDGTLYDKKSRVVIRGGKSGHIPSDCVEIGASAFDNAKIEELFIPASVEKIGDIAFDCCDHIKKITVDKANKKYVSNSNCIIERETGTLICAAVDTALPDDGSIKIIGEHAFRNSELTSITLPSSVQVIENSAFSYGAFVEVKLNKGLRVIEESAFSDCEKLEKIVFPDTLESIGCTAFSDCEKLKKIKIPKSVTCIEADAFEFCDELEEVEFEEIYGWEFDYGEEVSPQTLSVPEQAAELLKDDGRRLVRKDEEDI
ncbi:MAG: leucine-rich repeat domain-containing protein [Clostridiales bacterium]|nr:leucine-rich repeat domain-containing protein [Clostridiales bacterium]